MSSETGTPPEDTDGAASRNEDASARASDDAGFPVPLVKAGAQHRDIADIVVGGAPQRSDAQEASASAVGPSPQTVDVTVVTSEAQTPPDRGEVIGNAGRWLAGWCLRFLIIAVAAWILWQGAALIWAIVLPVILALILCTVLWPIVRKLRTWHFPPALAVLSTILVTFLIIGGIIATIAPSVARQSRDLIDQGVEGIQRILDWLAGPPFNLESDQLNSFIDQAVEWIQGQASQITQTAISGATAATSAVITLLTVLVLTFFFLKDGERFLPLVRRMTGRRVGWHLTEVLSRCWKTLGGFIRTQAIVSFIDAFFIGLGLVALSVPLAGPLAIITFFGGFIPIVGAFAAGALAVLVALVANGLSTAVAVLILIVAVQQLEGNLLSPVLQAKAMKMHAAVVLLSVSLGGGLWGIVGAFLAVPAAAMVTEVLRYLGDMADLATGEKQVDDIEFATIDTRQKRERIAQDNAKKHHFIARIFRRNAKKTPEKAESETSSE
ncbi:AI-2E family transporter [Actinomycetaceae bacterium L2_0104]